MLGGPASLTHICIGVSISSIFSALLEPSYRATVTDILSKEEYSKASGMISLAGSARYLISPMLAGLLLAVSDIKLLLVIDICSFIIKKRESNPERAKIVEKSCLWQVF